MYYDLGRGWRVKCSDEDCGRESLFPDLTRDEASVAAKLFDWQKRQGAWYCSEHATQLRIAG